jgi:hypothetical protein
MVHNPPSFRNYRTVQMLLLLINVISILISRECELLCESSTQLSEPPDVEYKLVLTATSLATFSDPKFHPEGR